MEASATELLSENIKINVQIKNLKSLLSDIQEERDHYYDMYKKYRPRRDPKTGRFVKAGK